MRKNQDLPAYLKSLNPIFSIFSCQFVITESVYSMVPGKNKPPSFKERYLVVATPGVFLIKNNNFLPGHSVEKIFPFILINRMEVNSDCIIISQSKTNYNSDDSPLIFKNVNQLIIASIIHTVRESLYGNTALPYEIKIDPSLVSDFARQKYVYHSSSKITDIFLSCALFYDFSKLQKSKLDNVCSILDQIQEYGTLDINSALMKKPYLASIAATLSIDNDIKEVRIFDVNLGSSHVQKFLISVLQRTKSIKRLIFIHVTFEESDFSEFAYYMQTNTYICSDEWIFDSCDFSKHTKFDKFFKLFKNYQRPVRILTFNRCNFSLAIFEEVIQYILFSDCFHSLEVLWVTNIGYNENVLSFIIQLMTSNKIIELKKLNSLAIIDCCVNLSELFEKIVTVKPTQIITANFSGNSFWSPVTNKLYETLPSHTNLIFRRCTFSDESLSSLFQALSLHKGKSLHLDCSGIAVSENGWKIFRKEIMGDANSDENNDNDNDNDNESNHLSKKMELKPICLGTLTELVWDNNVIDSNNVKAFTNFLKEQPLLRILSLNDCINVQSVLKKRRCFLENISSSSTDSDSVSVRTERKKSLLTFHYPRSSELEVEFSDSLDDDDPIAFEKEIEFIIQCFIDYVKSCKLNSIRIRSNLKSTCIGPKLFPLLEELLKLPRLRVLDILGQNIGDDNLEKVINLIPGSLEEFIFDGNSYTAEKLSNLLDQIVNISQHNFMINSNDQNTLNLKKVNFPNFDAKKCLENLSPTEKEEFQNSFDVLRKKYSKKFQPSDYIDDLNLNNNNRKSKKQLTDEFNNIGLNYALSKIHQYQHFSSRIDSDFDDDDKDKLNNNNDDFTKDARFLFRDEKIIKRRKISSFTLSIEGSDGIQFLSNDDENNKFNFSMNDKEIESILDECKFPEPKKDPMRLIMDKFSYEFSLKALTQNIDLTKS